MSGRPAAGRAPALAISIGIAAGGALVLSVGAAAAPGRAAASFLVAYTAALAAVVGMVLLVAITHLSAATWFVPFRPDAEAVIGSLPMLAALTLPLVLVPQAFWPWVARPDASSPSMRSFMARLVAYWIIWLVGGELLRRTADRQAAGDSAALGQLRRISAAAIPSVFLAITLAAFDWLMSLSPGWSSTVFGPYYFAGGMVSALALVAVSAWRNRKAHAPGAATPEHFHALGRLTLAAVLLWAYLWYVQFLIIWIADVPREVTWFIVRLGGIWRALAWTVLACGFTIPFVVLLFRAARRSPVVMGCIGCLLLAAHYLDVYWLIVPAVRPSWSFTGLVWDASALAFVAGSSTALAIWRHKGAPIVSIGDPLLDQSLRYETH